MATFLATILASLLIFISISSPVLALTLHRKPNHDNHNHNHLGFTVDFIHRDSPKSPFYNPSQTITDRLSKAFRRSLTRAKNLKNPKTTTTLNPSDQSLAESNLSSSVGEYLMEFSVGTPAFKILSIADTGSDITWTQCKPCKNCYNQTRPLFNPKSSKTFKTLACDASLCGDITGSVCDSPGAGQECPYTVNYGDGSYTSGSIGVEKLTLGSSGKRPVSFSGFGFGCGHDNKGTFSESSSGIVGLGNGEGSLVSQLGSYGVAEKFSYCLVPVLSKDSSKISFGANAVVSGRGTVSTPMSKESFHYTLNIKSISVGTKKIPFGQTAIIDSGTTLTLVPESIYNELESAVVSQIGNDLERVDDPDQTLSLCYKTATAEPGVDFPAPNLTVHYDGADVKLGSVNTFVRVADDVVCFSFLAAPVGLENIIGNLAQINFLVGYDLVENTVSFKPADCTKF